MNYLMHQDNAVKNFSALDVTRLFRRDDGRQYRLESAGYYLCQKFIDDVAEGNGSELLWMMSLSLFGYESEESSIKSLKDLSSGVGVLNNLPDLHSDHWLAMVEEIACKSIRARRFSLGSVLQCLIHLLDCDGS